MFSSKAEADINNLKIDDALEIAYQVTSSKVQKWLRESFGWKIELFYGHYISISSYNPLAGSSYIKLLVKLRN